MINKKRKYSYIKLDGCIGTALHQAVDRWNAAQGCTLRTGGELDLIRENKDYHKMERQHKTNRYIKNKSKVDEASIDRLLQGVCSTPKGKSPDHKENG